MTSSSRMDEQYFKRFTLTVKERLSLEGHHRELQIIPPNVALTEWYIMGRGKAPLLIQSVPTIFFASFHFKDCKIRDASSSVPTPSFHAISPSVTLDVFQSTHVVEMMKLIKALPNKQCQPGSSRKCPHSKHLFLRRFSTSQSSSVKYH